MIGWAGVEVAHAGDSRRHGASRRGQSAANLALIERALGPRLAAATLNRVLDALS